MRQQPGCVEKRSQHSDRREEDLSRVSGYGRLFCIWSFGEGECVFVCLVCVCMSDCECDE